MKNIFKNIKNWNSSLKLGTAIALGGAIIVGSSLIYSAANPDIDYPTSTTSVTMPSTTSTPTKPPVTSTPIVDEKVEEIIRPYTVDCEVAHYFYDENDEPSIREKAIVTIPGSNRTYMLSEGCDYTYNNTDFNVIASVSGTITDKINDKTFGDIVVLTHENGTKFVYASLSDVKVNKGQTVKQGDVLAKCGTSQYTEALGKSLHFEIIKGSKNLNPEKLYSSSIENL